MRVILQLPEISQSIDMNIDDALFGQLKFPAPPKSLENENELMKFNEVCEARSAAIEDVLTNYLEPALLALADGLGRPFP